MSRNRKQKPASAYQYYQKLVQDFDSLEREMESHQEEQCELRPVEWGAGFVWRALETSEVGTRLLWLADVWVQSVALGSTVKGIAREVHMPRLTKDRSWEVSSESLLGSAEALSCAIVGGIVVLNRGWDQQVLPGYRDDARSREESVRGGGKTEMRWIHVRLQKPAQAAPLHAASLRRVNLRAENYEAGYHSRRARPRASQASTETSTPTTRNRIQKTVGTRTTVPVCPVVVSQSQDPADVRGEGGDRHPKLHQRFSADDGYLLVVQVNTDDLYATRRASSTSSRSPSRGKRAPPVPFGAGIFVDTVTARSQSASVNVRAPESMPTTNL
ncbi:hypothetical protein ON010_g9410 [Phytophthora cinnamomi]|nr:hypothetical protein ON010_g9410 [Phytophthora cinnamomi]